MSPDLPEGIRVIALPGGELPGLQVENPFCQATFSLQGAQLLRFDPVGGKPLLWLSEKAAYLPGKAIRGGIPLCFPWFGPHPDDSGKPAHGFARNRLWQLEAASRDADGHTLRLSLTDDAGTRALWPHAFQAELELRLGRRLEIELRIRNTDSRPFAFTFALHSYFPVSDIAVTRVEGLDGVSFLDQLNPAAGQQTQQGAVHFSGETDRVYTTAGGPYHIDDGERRLTLTATACRSAVVWNPWREKTARLADMAADGWRGMLCVECGNVGSDQVSLAPGQLAAFRLCIP